MSNILPFRTKHHSERLAKGLKESERLAAMNSALDDIDYEETAEKLIELEREIMGEREVINEFLRGQRDCKRGIPHKPGSKDYDRGYSAQYRLEQVRTELTSKGER